MTQATGPPAGTPEGAAISPLSQVPRKRRAPERNPFLNLISPAWWDEFYAGVERIAWAIIRLIGLGGLVYIFIHNA